MDVAVASERETDRLLVLEFDPVSGLLTHIANNGGIQTSIEVYGLCLYTSPASGRLYAIVNSKTGEVEQWELFSINGAASGTRVRSFRLGSQVDGCVADNESSVLYVGEEDIGIWRYGAEPDSEGSPVLIDSTGPNGHLTPDVEGLTLYYASAGTGYLIASSQGSNSFVVYRRENKNEYIGTFRIGAGQGIDSVSVTDGITAIFIGLGQGFPFGVSIAQDDADLNERQNFKLVLWDSIADAFVPPLSIDTQWNPRGLSR